MPEKSRVIGWNVGLIAFNSTQNDLAVKCQIVSKPR